MPELVIQNGDSEGGHLFSTTTLIDCMAATPCAGGTRAKAFITKFEKAKKIPATRPEPSAAANVRR